MKKKIILFLSVALIVVGITTVIITCDPPQADDPNFLSVVASAYEMPADKQSTVTITATVYDNKHEFIADGTAVYFSANKGTLDAGVATTASGQASVTLTSDDNPGTAIVRAEVPSENRYRNSDPITMYDIGPQEIALWSAPNQIKANGKDSCTITAYITIDEAGNKPAPDGTEVSFNASKGSLASNTVATANGYAATTLTSDTLAGTCVVTATVSDKTAKINVEFTSIEATQIKLSSNTSSLRADGSSQATVTAEAWIDYPDQHVEDGTTIYFDTTLGTLSPTQVQTVDGKAVTTITSSTIAGWATITGTSGGDSDTLQIQFFDIGPAYIWLTASPNSIPADGSSTLIVNAVVRNALGEPVEQGTAVQFSTTAGTISPQSTTTDQSGAATATLTSSTNVQNNVKVTAVSGPAAANVYVNFTQPTSSQVNYIVVDLNPEQGEVGTADLQNIDVYVQVRNEYHQGLRNKFVQMDAECGLFTPDDNGYTNNNGVITFTYNAAVDCTEAKTITVSAISENVTGTDTLTILPGPTCTLVLTADSSVISGGTSGGSTTLRVTAIDQWGNFVRDNSVIQILIQSCGCSNCANVSLSNSSLRTFSGAASTTLQASSGANTGSSNCSVVIYAEASQHSNLSGCQWSDTITVEIAP